MCVLACSLCVCVRWTLPYKLCSWRIECVRLHQYDASLMWKYKEQTPSQPHSSPQQDTSTTVHVRTCAFESERREVETEKQRATSHNKRRKFSLLEFFPTTLRGRQQFGPGLCWAEALSCAVERNWHCVVMCPVMLVFFADELQL